MSNISYVKIVTRVEFEQCSNDVRIGSGRPYIVTYSDGSSRRQFATWRESAPKVGDTQAVYVPCGKRPPEGVYRRV